MGALSFTQSSNLKQKIKNEVPAGGFSLVAVAFADEEAAAAPAALPLPYWGGLGAYPYALPHAYGLPAPVQYQYVPKEVEIEVKTFQPELVETGCKNSFGTPVPCFQAGEARKRRDAEEAAAV